MVVSQANDASRTEFTQIYRFSAKYGYDTSPQSLHSLLGEMQEFGSSKFNAYYDAVYVDTRNDDYMPCGADCKASHLCAIEHVNYDDFDACYEQTINSARALTSSLLPITSVLVMLVISGFYDF